MFVQNGGGGGGGHRHLSFAENSGPRVPVIGSRLRAAQSAAARAFCRNKCGKSWTRGERL